MENNNELSLEQIKEKLLKLSAKGLIKKTSFQIKKMNEANCRIELEKYEQKMISETADKIKGIIFDGVSNGLSYLEVIDDVDKKRLEEELKTNCYLEDEVINISKSIAPWIPYIGLTLAGLSIAKYAYTRYHRKKEGVSPEARGASANTACTTPGGSKNKSSEDGNDTEQTEQRAEQTEPQRGD